MLKQGVALTLVVSLVFPACTTWKRVQVDPRLTRVSLVELTIVGITTTAGEIVNFDRRGKTVLLTTGGDSVTLGRRGRGVLTVTSGETVTHDRLGGTVFTRDDISAVEGFVNGERRRYATTDISAVWIEKKRLDAERTMPAVLAVVLFVGTRNTIVFGLGN